MKTINLNSWGRQWFVWVCLFMFFLLFFGVIQSANIVDWCFRCFRTFRCLFWKGGWDGRIQYWLGSSAVILAHDSMKGFNVGQVQLKGSPRLKTGWWGLPNKLDDFFPLSMYTSQCYVLGNFMQIRIPCLFHVFPNQPTPPKKHVHLGESFVHPGCAIDFVPPGWPSWRQLCVLPNEPSLLHEVLQIAHGFPSRPWTAKSGKVVVLWSQTPPKNGTRLMMWDRCILYSVLCLNSIFTTLHTIALVDS